jgi:hypothetical protein
MMQLVIIVTVFLVMEMLGGIYFQSCFLLIEGKACRHTALLRSAQACQLVSMLIQIEVYFIEINPVESDRFTIKKNRASHWQKHTG